MNKHLLIIISFLFRLLPLLLSSPSLSLFVATSMQDIYNYIRTKTHLSIVNTVAATLYLQLQYM